MSEPFLAEIRMVGFNFAPRGWALCDGQILPINQNQSLYSLLGITYGGDGRTSFALPDLRGRVPVHIGEGISLGQKGGTETVTLSAGQVPAHTHAPVSAAGPANNNLPADSLLAQSSQVYGAPVASSMVQMRKGTIGNAGGGAAHNNMQPYLTVNFVIALQGLFPSRN